jgi:L-lactate dehydrogenase complex protein LldG
VSPARDDVLGRVRAALRDVPAGEPERWDGPGGDGAPDAYRLGPAPDAPAPLHLFAERVADYRAEVVRCPADADVVRAIADACARHGARRVVAPAGLPAAWRVDGVEWLGDDPAAPLGVDALDAADGVLTGAAVAIAETGTIALDHGPAQGRRALTLLPDLHVCVVRDDQVVATVPEGLRRLRAAVDDGRPVTLVSGPSATSDIELQRVEGVHGPRRLVVLVAGGLR